MTPRAKYLRANIRMCEAVLAAVERAERDGVTEATIDECMIQASNGREDLMEHVKMLHRILAGEIDRLRTTPPKGSA